jgi:hypothetical protein
VASWAQLETTKKPSSFGGFERKQSQEYYAAEHKRKGVGEASIVAHAASKDRANADDCATDLLGGLNWTRNTSCPNCTCWELDESSSLLKIDLEELEMCLSIGEDPGSTVSPKKLSYEALKAAVLDAHQKLQRGDITEAVFRSDLETLGLNDKAQDAALGQARLGELEAWQGPDAWNNGTDMEQHIDVIMHLIFLKVVKSTMKMMTDFVTMRRKGASFNSFANGKMESIQEMQVEICKTLPWGKGTFGGYVSENYLGTLRVVRWLFSELGAS